MNTLTLVWEELVDYITGNGLVDVDDETIENEIDRYTTALVNALGDGFEVEVSNYEIQEKLNGHPLHCADEEIREQVGDAEATVAERFW